MSKNTIISTHNLNLIPCELQYLEAYFKGNNCLSQLLNIKIPEEWPASEQNNYKTTFSKTYDYLKKYPDIIGWWTYFFILKNQNILIGHGGFKGKANVKGEVEIGYVIIPSYRNKGFGTEVVQGLIDYAFSAPQVKKVTAFTNYLNIPSINVLNKVGMKPVNYINNNPTKEIFWTIFKNK